MTEFFQMGGYAAFVWPAYGIAFVVLVGMLVASIRNLRDAERRLQRSGPRRARRTARGGEQAVTAQEEPS